MENQIQSDLPVAVVEKYNSALQKKASLEKRLLTLKADIEKHELVISGMNEIMGLLQDKPKPAPQAEIRTDQVGLLPPVDLSKEAIKKRKMAAVWVSVIDWIGDKEVQAADVFDYCEEASLGVSRKQVTNWLNNSRIGGSLERVSNGVYKLSGDSGVS